jgi:RNA polymerase sigma factor (sigma-70 family)
MDTYLVEPEPANGADAPPAADDQLVRRFVATRDESAFAELVRRHSGLVLGVCRRTLRHQHDAEEAFQATFLVLAAKAAKIRVGHTVGPWLYGVAYRVATRAAAKRARRREAALVDDWPMIEDALQDVTDCHWQRVLDDEIDSLPEKYRAAVVLHYLLGKTNKQVAAELDLSERTVEGRQRRAKSLLKHRLMVRGVTLPTALAAVAATTTTSAPVAAPLVDAAVQAGLSFAQGNCAACSAHAVRLAQREVLAMPSLFAPVSATIVTVALLGGAITMAGGHGAAQGDGPLPLYAAVVALVGDEGGAEKSDADIFEGDATIQTTSAETPAQSAAPGNTDDVLERSKTDLVRYSKAEQRIIARLRNRTPPLDFTEIPLREVMQIIKEEIGGEVWIDEAALDEAGMNPDVSVTCNFQGLPLKTALRLMLRQVNLTYAVKDDVLVITTPEKADSMLEPHVYRLDSIVTSPIGLAELASVIAETVCPDTWSENGTGEGTIKTLGKNLLVINQSAVVHEEIEKFFAQLSEGGVQIEGSAAAAPASR